MNLRWFWSKTVRHASDLRSRVQAELNAQRDLLAPQAVQHVATALAEFRPTLRGARDDAALQQAMEKLEEKATKWLRPYPAASTRENLKEFLSSGVLILSIFNFFIQPMKIPSGSAQPTLYGNVVTDLRPDPEAAIPGRAQRFIDWFRGIDYHRWTAPQDGSLRIEPVMTTFGFIKRQRFGVGEESYVFWWPPDNLDRLCGVHSGQLFRQGETVLKLRISSGDRLFVDRFTYNFRRPERGEIIVFTSTGLEDLIQNTHYIKRLIGLPGEKVRLGNDRHVYIDGERLDASTPHFANVYTFTGPPQESVYSGHVNDAVALRHLGRSLARLFPNETTQFTVRPNHYLAFGDNTMNSFDGRAWGDFPREKVVGKALFVFWPFTERFGPVAYR
ncbi:MAG: signal peptidase I [Verrucomicrobia bacterium]|nr:signal peptidase I [Verrucomicrobiota bacterium]